MRYTIVHVRAALDSLVNLLPIVPDHTYRVRAGSPTYGRGWLLVSVHDVTGGQSPVINLGDSAREAFTALTAMRTGALLASPRDCRDAHGTVCSADVYAVHRGYTRPSVLCGRHADA